MRSKMLGLAIALSTFGLGVAATTAWIARTAPPASQTSQVIVTKRTVFVPSELPAPAEPFAPCDAKTGGAAHQTGARAVETTIRGGILNGKAVSHPAPAYPEAARTAGVTGPVVVEATVDECGNVVEARAVSGLPLLRRPAVEAAYKWRFAPTLLAGQPVRVSGTITFNFLLQ